MYEKAFDGDGRITVGVKEDYPEPGLAMVTLSMKGEEVRLWPSEVDKMLPHLVGTKKYAEHYWKLHAAKKDLAATACE